MDRLLDWKNGAGMQLTNALAATGSAGLFGYGFGNTPIYFPEPQTDFIFSVFTSNFGFIPALVLILLILYFDTFLVWYNCFYEMNMLMQKLRTIFRIG